jgi:type IV pilus secretin PilQ/predicted competence protein
MKMRCVEFRKSLAKQRAACAAAVLLMCCLPLSVSALSEDGAGQKIPGSPMPSKQSDVLKLPATPLPVPEKPLPAGAVSSLTNVTTAQEDGNLVVSVALTAGAAKTQEFLLSDPPRLVVDLLNVDNRAPFFNLPIGSTGVKQLRVRQFQSIEPRIARLVFDLDETHGRHVTELDGSAVKITFHPRDSAASSGSGKPLAMPSVSVAASPRADSKVAPPPPPPPAPKPAQPKSEQAAQAAKPAEKPGTVPIIRDLATTEIPRSALAAAAPQPKPQPPAPVAVKERAFAAPAAAAPAAPAAAPLPVGPVDSRFSGHPLTLDLVDISLIDFFRLMSEEGGINVVMDPEIKGNLSIKVVKVPWDQIFEAALANNGLDKQIDGNLVRIARKNTLQEEARQRESLKKANLLAADLETRIKRLNYAKALGFVAPLSEQKTVRGTVVVDERTNSLIISDIPSSVDRMVQLVETLDIPQPQVEIEARIVSATRDFARDIGVQFGFVQGNLERVTVGGPNTFGTIGGTRPSATPTNTYAAGNSSTGRGASQSTSSQTGAVSTGTSTNNAGNYNVNLPAQKAFGGLGISVGNIFDTFLLDAAITAGETKGLAKLISQPKVTAQNNSAATITQGLRFPVQIIANNTITVQFQNAALTLVVTPQITYEGNVVLDLKVENNTPDFSRQVNGIPSIRTSESATRVQVTDGGTTVIGGILLDNETTNEDRVPGLASLPVIGNVFKRTSVSHSTQEVLFFITPRIIK